MTHLRITRRAAGVLLAAALVTVFAAAPAGATLGPPVKVKLLGSPAAAEAGREWKGRLEVMVGAPVALTNFRLEGQGWGGVRLDAPAIATMQKSDVMVVNVTARPEDPSQPLVFAFDVDGRTFTKTLDLSAANAARALAPGKSAKAALETPERGPAPPAKDMAGPGPEMSGVELTTATGDKAAARNIRVRGRIVYYPDKNDTLRGVDGATVKVCDSNPPFDATLAVATTDWDGYYDVTFYWNGCWNCGDNPDLYVRYESENNRSRIEDATWETVYGWNTDPTYNYTGTYLDLGEDFPLNRDEHAGLHLLTAGTRIWRWFSSYRGYDVGKVDVQWRDGSGAYYNSVFGEIHIGQDREWYEDTLAHEYGHHWMQNYAWNTNPGYCNSVCDGDLLDCGHCFWCPEDQGIAWTEGWPNWLAHVVVATFWHDYGTKPLHTRNAETPILCDELGTVTPYLGDPLVTEGMVAALLEDISDATTADTHTLFPGYIDDLAVGDGPIFICTDLDEPTSVTDFLLKFKSRYAGWAEQIWRTAKNSGYEIDYAPPDPVTVLNSTSHVTTGSSPDPTIDLEWVEPADDASGVAGYSLLVTTAGPVLPPATQNVGDVTEYTTAILAPGTYWVNLRAVDRVGHWALVQKTIGPFTIRTAEPSNLAFKPLEGWGSVVVPRGAADATAGSVPVPTTLAGDVSSTWWNTALQNTGDVATSTFFQVNGLVDGKQASGWGVGGPLGGLTTLTALNLGPMTVRGGRHVFEVRLDGSDVIPELNENDNRWARQWSWTPPSLTAMTPYARTAPPDQYGGHASIGEGFYTVNSDGLRYASSGWWNAVAIVPANNTDDYDLYGHAAGSGATDGFLSYNGGGSARVAGYLDATIVNRNAVGLQNWDVGVVNYSGGTGNYNVTHHTSYAVTAGNPPQTVTLAAGEMLRLWEFYVAPGSEGPYTLAVSSGTPSLPVSVSWFDYAFTVGGITGASAQLKTGADGTARLDVNIANFGYHAMVVHRDPRDGTASVAVTYEIARTKPDLLPVTLSGWAAPLVPRPAADGTVWTVAAPDTLIGESASTWLNLVVENQSVVDAAAQTVTVNLDGVAARAYPCGVVPAGGSVMVNDATAVTVRGGRHTLVVRADSGAEVAESFETNNAWGSQYAWSPYTVPLNEARGRAAPPSPTVGWSLVATGDPLYYNCDGLRIPSRTARWRGLAVMPAERSDVDLQLHAPMTDPTTGFSSQLAMSGWGAEQGDFVLINDSRAGHGVFDVGVTAFENPQDYLPEATAATTLVDNGEGVYGPWAFAANHLLDLRAVYLDVGLWDIRLESLEGAIDWGMSLYSSGSTYVGKSNTVFGGIAFGNGDGVDEFMSAQVSVAGWHCLAVWKVGIADVDKAGAYRLRFARGASPVPDTPPAVPVATALVDVRPNPFNPRTTVTFDLAAGGRASLAVYDLRGALVRRLVDADLPAGRHDAVWDGCDQSGQGVASGVYVARFEAGVVRQMKRMVLIR